MNNLSRVLAGMACAVGTASAFAAPLGVSSQPIGLSATVDSTINLTVGVSGGTPPLSYQWSRDGINLSFGTNATLVITNVQPANIGSYNVTVKDSLANSVTSSNAVLGVNGVYSGIWSNLVAYYPFNGNLNDATGNGLDGTNYGAVLATNHLNQAGSGYYFQNAYAQFSNIPFNLAGAYTFSYWVKMQQYDDWGVTAEFTDPQFNCNYNPTFFEVSSTLTFCPCGGSATASFGAVSSLVGQWHHLVTTVDSLQNTLFYKDGLLIGSANLSLPATSKAVLVLGKSSNIGAPGAQYSHATIDSVRVYNRALGSNDVAALYASEAPQPAPYFIQNLTNLSAVAGQNASLSVTVGSAPLNYQWFFVPTITNNAGQAGAYAELAGKFVYGAVVTNGGFGYGNVPNVSFAGGGGSGAVGYAAISNGMVVSITMSNAGSGYTSAPAIVLDPPNGWLLGQTNSTLTISNANAASVGAYYVVVSNSNGSITSSVANLTLVYPPAITSNPQGFIQNYHTSQALTVVAAGTPPFTYQWSLNGTNLNGATNSSYYLASLNLSDAGAYVVGVTNAYGYTNSAPAYVYVAPTLTSPFSGAIGMWGQDTDLGVGAVGSGTLSYQWYFNGAAISGATSSNLVLSGIQFTNAGFYSVVVGSAYGSVTNAAYQVVVNPANISIGTFPGVYIVGTVGYNYTIQGNTDLSNTNGWATATNITLTAPSQLWFDASADLTKPANAHKFYRVIPGQ